jgi:diacylglycerol kinase (ATP)
VTNHNNTPSVFRESPAIIFVNSSAGGNRSRLHLPRIRKLFEALELHAEFVVTESAVELESGARTAIVQKHRLLLAMGGDGTFQSLVNAAFGADVVLGVLPSGGGNDFAAALGLRDDPLQAAEAILHGKTKSVDLVRVRAADGQTRLYAGGGGVGLDAEAARYASGAYRHIPGRFRYIASALRALVGYAPLEVHLDFPGTDIATMKAKALLTCVLNTPTYGAGLRFAPEAQIDDGSLNVVLIEDLNFLGVLSLLPRLMASGELRTSRVKRWNVKRVRLTTNPPALFHGDGEILGPTPVELEVVPQAVRVLGPARV